MSLQERRWFILALISLSFWTLYLSRSHLQVLYGTHGPTKSLATSATSEIVAPSSASSQDAAPTSATPTPAPRLKKAALVSAGRESTDTEWMASVEDFYDLYRYNVDDQDPDRKLKIPANKGHEAMVYLSFIIDNYDTLPPHTVFIHGHEKSWHQQDDLVPLLKNLKTRALGRVGYVSLRCDWYPSCPAEIRPRKHDAVVWGPGVHREDTEWVISDVWSRLFPREELPDTIASPCCAQFAVTRAAIRSRSREEYVGMRQWLLDTDLIDDISGRVLEKLWAYIFIHKAVHCPNQDSCACNYFGDCEAREWPEVPEELLRAARSWTPGMELAS